MVQIMQFLHMQGDPFHFLSNVLNSEIFSIVLIPLLIEFHNLAPSYKYGHTVLPFMEHYQIKH